MIDFGSPNVAKPMHIGHIRSIVLGDALARIAPFLGHEVIRDNHIGDWGTQFGMVIYGWKNLLDRHSARARSDCRAGPDLQGDERESDTPIRQCAKPAGRNWSNCRLATRKTVASGKRCVELSMQDFERTYRAARHSLRHPARRKLLQRSAARRGRPLAQIRHRRDERRRGLSFSFATFRSWRTNRASFAKRDGGFNYATTDIATVDYRDQRS